MQTIVLATEKGGSGKTTLAIGLALAAIHAGHTVRLIETDAQGTLSNWQSRRPYAEPIVEPIYAAGDFEQRLQSLDREGITLAIIDTAGGVGAVTNAAIRYADFCLIRRVEHCRYRATASTLDGPRRTGRSPSSSIRRRSAASASPTRPLRLGEEAAPRAGVVATPFCVMRNDHQDEIRAGLAVNEYAAASKSADESRGLWQWVEARLSAGAAIPHEPFIGEGQEAPLAPMFIETPAEAAAFVA